MVECIISSIWSGSITKKKFKQAQALRNGQYKTGTDTELLRTYVKYLDQKANYQYYIF